MSGKEPLEALEDGLEAFNNGNNQAYIDLYADTVELPGSAADGKESLEEMYGAIFSALPDMTIEIKKHMVDGDTVSLIYRWEGTHEGELLGVPPTGEKIVFDRGMTWMQFNDSGKIVKRWVPPGTWNHIKQQVRDAADGDVELAEEIV